MAAPTRPVRSATAVRPAGLGLPGARIPLLRGGRPLKRWRYVGLYGQDLMLCAGRVWVGGLGQSFWAVWDREAGALRERTTLLTRPVALPDGGVEIRARGVRVRLRLSAFGDPVQVLSPHGGSWIWTRKHLAQAQGTVVLDGRTRPVRGVALIDDSVGYHARQTAWEWSAGTGTASDGRAVAWNLVAGVHDAPGASERTVWIDGRAREVAPVTFTSGLDGVAFAQGDGLAFAAESVRERHDRAGPLRSDYVQPFGAFAGSLPGVGELAGGLGVMERHRAVW